MIRQFSQLNYPPLVAAAGASIILGLPVVEAAAASSASLGLLKAANVAGFITNATAVSIPGRRDGSQDQKMRQGVINPSKPTGINESASNKEQEGKDATSETPLVGDAASAPSYTCARTRSLVNPSGWAFSIWGPIYLGEAAFVTTQLLASEGSTLSTVIPQVTAPFVAANLLQSLWCASFRPSYNEGWRKYVSVAMLAGTAYSLSCVQSIGCSEEVASIGWYFIPMSIHFGWTTAATLVDLNGAVAMDETKSDSTVIAVGHASVVAATTFGVGITLAQLCPAYGLTVGWALAACADNMKKRVATISSSNITGDASRMKKGMTVQQYLCWAGSSACVLSSLFVTLS